MKPTTKRYLLIALLCLTGLATVFTIAVSFAGGGSAEDFAVMAGMGIGFLVLISFAAFTAIDKPWWRFPAGAGMAIAALMMVIHPFFAWAQANRVYSYSAATTAAVIAGRDWFELMGSLVGTGFTVAGLLCLVPFVMAPNIKLLGRLLQIATAFAQLLLFFTSQLMIWRNDIFSRREFEQLLFASFIFSAAGTLAVAILNKFFGIKIANPVTYSAATLHVQCPRCLQFLDLPMGESACKFCKLKFTLDVEEPLCPTCGYNLHNLPNPRCPECGTDLTPSGLSPPAPIAAPATT